MARSFPIVYVRDIPKALEFYGELLGYEEQSRVPAEGDAMFVGLRRDASELGLVHESSPQQLINQGIGDGPRFEMFVYVDNVDDTVGKLREADVSVLREPETMPWGERIAYVSDPEGNPITVAASPA
ncbi:MAG TPA: VOC family protein [Solirubrobacteraceae bacterium]|nr:VOC family protein [Solirubrobacteraceae bacterium]